MAYAQVDGINIYYSMPRGAAKYKEQVLALLIHGGGGSTRHWEPLVAQLPAQFCPLLIDLPGHGHSGGTVPHSIEQTAILLDHFLQSLAVKQPLWCIGHSMGGLIAQYFALHYPSYIERLVLIATAARIRLHRDFVQAALTNQWNLELFRSSFGPDIPLDIQNLVLHEYPKMRAAHADVDFMGLNAIDLRPEVSALQIPVLLIVGGDDVIISPRHARTLFQALPHATLLVIPDGGHYVHVEQPQRIAQILAQLIQETPSPI
jgi:pimeloyl-ACP methyl ester carboxylesterase